MALLGVEVGITFGDIGGVALVGKRVKALYAGAIDAHIVRQLHGRHRANHIRCHHRGHHIVHTCRIVALGIVVEIYIHI